MTWVFETRRLKEYHGKWGKEENLDTIILWKMLYYINIDNCSMRHVYCEKKEFTIFLHSANKNMSCSIKSLVCFDINHHYIHPCPNFSCTPSPRKSCMPLKLFQSCSTSCQVHLCSGLQWPSPQGPWRGSK